jgi:hypothetical protein
LVRKPEGKRPVGRPKHRRKNITIYLRETEWEGVDWINLAQDRNQWQALVDTVINFWVPQKTRNFLTS